jgi:hypothetical protein
MKYRWLKQAEGQKLIVFFNGWGMDEKPFSRLKTSDYDIMMCYNYGTLDLDNIKHEVSGYEDITVIAWSMGVWAASQLLDSSWHISNSIALNGTPNPIHDQFGIPPVIYQKTLDSMSEASRLRFFQRMFAERNCFKQFLNTKPERTLDDQIHELAAIQQLVKNNSERVFSFDKVIVSKNDRIIPGKNQLNYWQTHGNVTVINEGHFPFFIWESWKDIINYES